MIFRVPNEQVLKWLYPDMYVEPRCYLEVDICWDGRVYIEPFMVYSLDGIYERKFDSKERAELRRYVTLDNSVSPICGKWRVKMAAKWLFWFRNVKYIQQNTDGSIQGHNVAWGWLKWGDFDVGVLTPGAWNFRYKYFHDYVLLMDIHHWDTKPSGQLWFRDKIRATFTMTRILPGQ